MKCIVRLFARDLAFLSRSPVLLTLVLIVPLILLLLIGHLNVRPMVTRVAVVAESNEAHDEPTDVSPMHKRLRELSSVEVFDWPADISDLRDRAAREDVDIVLVPFEDTWRMFGAIVHTAHSASAQEVAQLIRLSLEREQRLLQRQERLDQLENALQSSSEADTAPPLGYHEALGVVQELRTAADEEAAVSAVLAGVWLSRQFTPLFESSNAAKHALVPGFISLIAVFVPFFLASTAIVREREAGTLAGLVVVSNRRWSVVAAGKLMLPLLAGMLAVAALLVTAQIAFGYGIKPGLAQALLVQAIAVLVSALLGLSVSSLLESSQEAYAVSAVYLVALILLTGMVQPLEQSATAVVAAAHLFPLTVAAPALEAWMIAGASAVMQSQAWLVLGLQSVAALALCAIALRRLKARL